MSVVITLPDEISDETATRIRDVLHELGDAFYELGVVGEPTIADAVLDRIVHNAYRIELKGESQRKRNKPPPLDGGDGNRAPA